MKTAQYKLTVTFTTDVLGTQPQRDVAVEYITSKAPEQLDTTDEEATLPQLLEKGTTAFHAEHGQPIYYDYMVKGFLKEAGQVFNSIGKVKALRSKIDNYVFVSPRRFPLVLPAGGTKEHLSRPLRAQTAQGPRTSLARSEMLPAGTHFTCTLTVLSPQVITEKVLRELLDYGQYKGFGQWRNGSHGQFRYSLEKLSGPPEEAEAEA